MAANIFGDRFYGRREPAWHGLGKTFDGQMTAVQAVADAGLDYNIHLLPAQVLIGDQSVNLPGRFIIMREPTPDSNEWVQFGPNMVSEDYTILQNRDFAALMEPLAEKWPVETVGALGNGETVFLTLSAGQVDIRGDEIKLFFLVTDTRDGGTSAKIALTPVRTVCQNTLVSGLRSATVSVDITHKPGMATTVKSYMDLTAALHGSIDNLMVAFNRMSVTNVSADEAKQVFFAAYPDPKRPRKLDMLPAEDVADIPELYEERTEAEDLFAYYATRASAFRSAAADLFTKINDEYPDIAGTSWAAYNAVVECEDFRRGSGSIGQSALFGPRAAAKKRAFQAAYAF